MSCVHLEGYKRLPSPAISLDLATMAGIIQQDGPRVSAQGVIAAAGSADCGGVTTSKEALAKV